MMTARTTKEVFEDHLQLALTNEWHSDLERNFSSHCVLLTGFGVFQGLEGVMDAANLLMKQLPNARYIYRTRLWHDEMAFLEWEAVADGVRVEDGADSYLIRNGAIEIMTIHYTPIYSAHHVAFKYKI